ncbi:unnamed protein product, partial [Mesorhabditis belari]|uniref:Uncharacterized protein n=1 Tax=Mesorhabditis belari TaxID=2138241 RepID=A0AAF3F4Y4_9BILA
MDRMYYVAGVRALLKTKGRNTAKMIGKTEVIIFEECAKDARNEPSKLPENISSLKKLQSYFRKVDLCNDYLKTMNEENQKVLNRLNIPLKSKNPNLETVTAAYTEIVDLVNVFLNHSSKFPSFRDKYSVLSPDLLPILPETAKKDGKRKILSPRMLSFYKDGFFSLQDLFKEITNNRKEQWDLLNTVMDLSGASTSMQNVLQKIRPQIDRMNSVEFPAIREMSLLDLTVLKAMKTINEKQKEQMNQKSYFFYEKPQLDRIFSSPSRCFTWEVVALSPEAFILELLDPTFMVFDVLSPRAFFATILSPAAFVARTLSPTALRAEVLAPRAFNSWVLSPEAMIVEVLTPKFFEPRVMSPEALVIDILSPNIISPHVSSPELVGIAVLSPKILSPRVLNSEERFMVEILSPHLLSGQHSEEEEEDNISFGGLETHEGHHHAPVDSPGGTVSGASHSNEPFAPGHLHPADHLLGQPRIFPFGSFPG